MTWTTRDDYKQQIYNIDYTINQIKISLTRGDWNSVDTWVSSNRNGTERGGSEWFQDLENMIMWPISKDVNFSGKNYPYDQKITFGIPRQLLRYFVYSIGMVAYDLDVKSPTSIGAQDILNTVNEQLVNELPNGDKWFKTNF